MYFFQKNKFKLIIALITVFLAIIMVVAGSDGKKIFLISDTVNFIVSPVQKAVGRMSSGISDFFANFESNKNFARENEELKKTIATLEDQVRKNDSLILENNRLRQMLELSQKESDLEYVAADIIAYDITNWSKTYSLNKGLIHGISKNSAVVTPNGLVGYVYAVGRNWSKVVAITDSSVSVGAKITRLNVNAVISGDVSLQNTGKCAMKYLTRDINVELGDYAVTSGGGGIYPEGLYIGKIVELNEDISGLSQEAIIEPGVDFNDLSEVMVIKK